MRGSQGTENNVSFETYTFGIDTMSITVDSATLQPVREKVMTQLRPRE